VSWIASSDLLSLCLKLIESNAPKEDDEQQQEEEEEEEECLWSVRRCEEDVNVVGLNVVASSNVMMQRIVDFL
jgi:hypothetical protein